MKLPWIILVGAGLVAAASWTALAAAYLFFEPGIALWTGLVTVAALALEGFFWVAAGVLGWSFLAGRRAMLERLKRRFPGGRGSR